jgi:hypothetical protein
MFILFFHRATSKLLVELCEQPVFLTLSGRQEWKSLWKRPLTFVDSLTNQGAAFESPDPPQTRIGSFQKNE